MRVSFCMCTCCVSCMYVKIVSKVSEKVEYKRCLCVYYATPKATERPNFEACKRATFASEEELYSFLFTLLKVARLHSHFSLSIFWQQRREIDHLVVPSEVVCLRPCPPQYLARSPSPLHTMIPQSKTIILCSICTHTQTLRTATAASLFWSWKKKEKLETQIRASSSKFLPQMLFVLSSFKLEILRTWQPAKLQHIWWNKGAKNRPARRDHFRS